MRMLECPRRPVLHRLYPLPLRAGLGALLRHHSTSRQGQADEASQAIRRLGVADGGGGGATDGRHTVSETLPGWGDT